MARYWPIPGNASRSDRVRGNRHARLTIAPDNARNAVARRRDRPTRCRILSSSLWLSRDRLLQDRLRRRNCGGNTATVSSRMRCGSTSAKQAPGSGTLRRARKERPLPLNHDRRSHRTSSRREVSRPVSWFTGCSAGLGDRLLKCQLTSPNDRYQRLGERSAFNGVMHRSVAGGAQGSDIFW